MCIRDRHGVIQEAIRAIKAKYPDFYVITDVCMCEYTDHGHCGILCGYEVDNDKTLEVLSKTALSHVQAGADMVAPSDMMDGRIAAIRQTLDAHGYTTVSYTHLDVYKRQPIRRMASPVGISGAAISTGSLTRASVPRPSSTAS